MASTIYLSGKGKWMHRLFEFDEFRGKKYWSMVLYPDPKSWETFKQAGLQQKVKQDDDGKYVTFRRNVAKPWRLKPGESPEFEPPYVQDSDGKPWENRGVVGNGSGVTIKLEVYPANGGIGTRLVSVRVDDWVQYQAPVDQPDAGHVDGDFHNDVIPF